MLDILQISLGIFLRTWSCTTKLLVNFYCTIIYRLRGS